MSPTQEKDRQDKPGGKPAEVKVTVTFPLAAKAPYDADVEGTATADGLRVAAMSYFGVADEPTVTYYLTHKGGRVADTESIGSLADNARAVKLTLAKELIQG
jgi:hypothetical protein